MAVALAREVSRTPDAALSQACVEVLEVSGVGVTVMAGASAGGPVSVSSDRLTALEDLQFTLGVGPRQDAYATGQPVHAPRLDQVAVRWPSFVDLAVSSGISAVFAYPMSSRGSKVGVLTLYQDAEGELTSGQEAASVVVAQVLAETILSLQDEAPIGGLAPELEPAAAYRAEIHQAAGMVSVQLDVPVADALLRLRAHAFANDEPLTNVASDVVGRRLRFSDDRPEGTNRA